MGKKRSNENIKELILKETENLLKKEFFGYFFKRCC